MNECKKEKRGGICFYNCDNIEFMKTKPDNYYDLAIVDPPYGGNDAIDLKDNTGVKKQATKRTKYKVFENTPPTVEYFDELKRVSKNQIIWGVNFYKNYDLTGGRLCWDKKGVIQYCLLIIESSIALYSQLKIHYILALLQHLGLQVLS